MSQTYEIRKIHHEGAERISMGMTIPQKYLKELEVKHGSYVKIYLDEKGAKRIWIEKLDK